MLSGSLDQLISDWAWEILFSTSGAGKTQEADVYTVSLKPKSGHYQQLQPIAAMSSQLLAAANCSHLQPHLLRAAICSNLQQLAHSSHLSSHLQPLAAICRENSQTAPGECWEFSGAFNRRASWLVTGHHGRHEGKNARKRRQSLSRRRFGGAQDGQRGRQKLFNFSMGPPCLLKSNMRIRPASSYRYRNLTRYLFKDCLQAGCLGYFSRFGNLPWVESTCIGSIPASIFLRP